MLLLSFVFLMLAALVRAKGKDAFSTLGVKRSASDKEIKAAYRQLSLKYHPDKNPDSKDNTKFIEISEAYEQIGDSKSRKDYLQNLAMEGSRQGHAQHFHHRRNGHAQAEDIFRAFDRHFGEEFGGFNSHRGRNRGYKRREFRFKNGGGGGHYSYSYSSFDEAKFPSVFGAIWSIGRLIFLPLLSTMGPLIMLLIYCCCLPSGDRESSRNADRRKEGRASEDAANAQQLPALLDLNVPKGVIMVASLDQYSEELLHLASPMFKHDSTLRLCRCDNGIQETDEGEERQQESGPRFRGISVCSRGHAFYTGLAHESDEEAVAAVVLWIEKLISGEVSWKSNDELAFVDEKEEEANGEE